jgi:hypothetical protein
MQTTWDFAGSTDMWSTSAGGHLIKVVNLTGFTVLHNYSHMKMEQTECSETLAFKLQRMMGYPEEG